MAPTIGHHRLELIVANRSACRKPLRHQKDSLHHDYGTDLPAGRGRWWCLPVARSVDFSSRLSGRSCTHAQVCPPGKKPPCKIQSPEKRYICIFYAFTDPF